MALSLDTLHVMASPWSVWVAFQDERIYVILVLPVAVDGVAVISPEERLVDNTVQSPARSS